MAKAIVRFGVKGEKRASMIMPIKQAAALAHNLDFVYGTRHRTDYVPGDIKFFTVSRRVTRVSTENPYGYYVEVEYAPHA